MAFIALLPIIAGVLVSWRGFLAWHGRIPVGGAAGVRTWATLRSDEAFHVANRVASLPTLAGGAVGVAAGSAALAMPDTAGIAIATALGSIGLVVLAGAGGVLGDRAAAAVPAPARATADCCGGCACGA